jgi:antitoxin (DNA-binding transcriptional repressor) of toxin-antitoxin stability system
MKTIGAKELRLHLDQVFDQVLSGEDIIVSHRFKKAVRLSAASATPATKPKRLAGLHAFDAAPKQKSALDADKSIKDLYNESITKKYVS